jgi:pilus assembly protein Flp/PilA
VARPPLVQRPVDYEGGGPVVAYLAEPLYAEFRRRANDLQKPASALASMLLSAIAESDLYKAVLDEWVPVVGDGVMKTLELIKRLAEDEDGAALLEYTVLLGILLVAVIGTITLVGDWINDKWTALNGALPANK